MNARRPMRQGAWTLTEVREPVRHPRRGQNDVEQVSAPVLRFPKRVIRRSETEYREHEDRRLKPIEKGQKQHRLQSTAGESRDCHHEERQANQNAENHTGQRHEIQLNPGGTMTVARMKFLFLIALSGMVLLGLVAAVAAEAPARDSAQPFRLASGDFRGIPFTVRQTPTEVECRFEVLRGNPSVHIELLPMREFRLFDPGEEHDTMALTPDARTGDFRRVIDTRGRFALVIVNAKNAPPAIVTLDLKTNVNPDNSDVARTLPPQRQLAVILISFAFFFITVTWSSRKLIRAMRASGR